MPSDPLDIVVPSRPGLHLLLDAPHGDSHSLAMRLAADAIDRGTPAVCVLLDEAAPQFRSGLTRAGVDVDAAEADGDLHYVDAYAPRVGWAHTTPATVFAERPGTDAILLGISEAQAGLIGHAREHLVVLSTLSSFLVLEGLHETYELCQALASMAPRMGAVTLGRVIPEMHKGREVTALQHLATTVTDLRTGGPKGTADLSARDPDASTREGTGHGKS